MDCPPKGSPQSSEMRNANYYIFKQKSKENGQKSTFFGHSRIPACLSLTLRRQRAGSRDPENTAEKSFTPH